MGNAESVVVQKRLARFRPEERPVVERVFDRLQAGAGASSGATGKTVTLEMLTVGLRLTHCNCVDVYISGLKHTINRKGLTFWRSLGSMLWSHACKWCFCFVLSPSFPGIYGQPGSRPHGEEGLPLHMYY